MRRAINPVFMQSLGVEDAVLKLLEIVPHEWVEVAGGAIVFFTTQSGKDHSIVYHLPSLSANELIVFWQQVGNYPRMKGTALGACLRGEEISRDASDCLAHSKSMDAMYPSDGLD